MANVERLAQDCEASREVLKADNKFTVAQAVLLEAAWTTTPPPMPKGSRLTGAVQECRSTRINLCRQRFALPAPLQFMEAISHE